MQIDKIIQLKVNDLPEVLWDVVIVGAGPSGSIASWFLAKKGHKVLLLDKNKFPREKVCGDGLNHDSIRFLKKNGLYKTVQSVCHEIQNAIVYGPSRKQLVIPGPYLTLKRKHFDTFLANISVHSGTVFCHVNVTLFYKECDNIFSIQVKGYNRKLKARYIILSTGVNIGLARSLNLTKNIFPSGIAMRCYLQSKEKMDSFIGSYDRSVLPGYGWIFPMGEDLYNIGVIAFYTKGYKAGACLEKRFDSFLKNFPLAQNLLNAGKIISPLKRAPLRCGLPDTIIPGKNNLLVTGETIGSTLNLTGEGIGKAMETGELAAKIIHDSLSGLGSDIVLRYKQELDRQFRPKYKGYLTAERWLTKPRLIDFINRRALRSNYLKNAALDIILNETDPRKVFSIGGIIKSFWS